MREVNNQPMRDELTTKMHAEFIGDEIPYFNLCVMAVYGATKRGIPIDKALKDNGLTEEEYDNNVQRVIWG